MDPFEINIPLVSKAYNSAIAELLKSLKVSRTLMEIRKLFNEFSNKFTTLPELWKMWYELEENMGYPDYVEHTMNVYLGEIKLKAESHFIFDELLSDVNFLCRTSDEQHYSEHLLSFPQEKLENRSNYWKIFSSRPLSPSALKKLEMAMMMSNKIIEANDNVEKWFECLTKWDDEQFVMDTVEYKVGNDPTNVKLWKLYLNYLKSKNNHEGLLNVYLRYCRMFIEDSKARQEYRNEIERIVNLAYDVTKWWIDIIEFERVFGTIHKARLMLQAIVKKYGTSQMRTFAAEFENQYGCKQLYSKVVKKEVTTNVVAINGSKENEKAATDKKNNLISYEQSSQTSKTHCVADFVNGVTNQYFHLPFPLINYIFQNSSYELQHRFYECCKYFFIKSGKKLLCYKLSVIDIERHLTNFLLKFKTSPFSPFINQSLLMSHIEVEARNLSNLTVTNFFNVSSGINNASTLLSKIQVKVKYLLLCSQQLTVAELALLFSPRLEEASFGGVTISDYDRVPSEKIIEIFLSVPNLNIIDTAFLLPDTAEFLSNLKSNQTLKIFSLQCLPHLFNVNHFSTFLMNNCAPGAIVKFSFEPGVPHDFKTNFANILENNLKSNHVHVSLEDFYLFYRQANL